MNFKTNSRPLFTTIFKLKNDSLKTRDFSPLIGRVLAGVYEVNFQRLVSMANLALPFLIFGSFQEVL